MPADAAYTDRAKKRRRLVGSEHPSTAPRDAAPAHVLQPLSAENKGSPSHPTTPASASCLAFHGGCGCRFKLLSAMGWSGPGSGLGKEGQGVAEPVRPAAQLGKAGLGSKAELPPQEATPQELARRRHVAMMQQRSATHHYPNAPTQSTTLPASKMWTIGKPPRGSKTTGTESLWSNHSVLSMLLGFPDESKCARGFHLLCKNSGCYYYVGSV